eukprot:GHVP01019512.1.p1 GENE.GHVP01019512.1~~GHVP01019512.1.p1  ORF type:complete len:224 (-),score=62.83 GHVP01019512.1:718-1389(-)
MQQVGISPKPDAKAAAVITGKPAAVPKEPSKKKNGFLCCGGDPVREPEKKISELETKNSEEALQNKSSSMEKLEIAKLNRGISYVSTVPMMLTSEEVEEEEAAVFGHSKEFGSVLENQGSSKIRKSKEFGLKGSEISQRLDSGSNLSRKISKKSSTNKSQHLINKEITSQVSLGHLDSTKAPSRYSLSSVEESFRKATTRMPTQYQNIVNDETSNSAGTDVSD